MLQRQIYAVVFKDAVVFAQIIIAEADGVIITSDDGEFHFRVSHQVTVLLSVMGDADDFSVSRKSSNFFDNNGHESRIVVDFGMAAFSQHIRPMEHCFIELLDDEFGTGVETFHGHFFPFGRHSPKPDISFRSSPESAKNVILAVTTEGSRVQISFLHLLADVLP